MAIAGGTSNYFPATSASALTSDLQVILASILAVRTSGTAPSVSSSSLNNGSVTYLASFDTKDTDQDWTGDLAAWPISSTTGQVNESGSPIWDAQSQLDLELWTNRLIATWDPVRAAGTPFEWTTGTTATSGIASSTALGRALMTNSADASGQDALQYLHGARSLEISGGGQYRNRTHVLGDIVDSGPLYVGAPSGSSTDSTYLTFQNTYATRPAVV
jgi:type IV pilus assembly protein PilY1